MNVVFLSGGSGQRLWPLSNDVRSKQFIKIFKKDNGEYESMVQRIYGQIKAVDPDATITIATSKSQVSAINNQLGDEVGISVEPCRRDTFAAIALATAYLHDVQGVSDSESVVVCPVDPYVDESYFRCVKELYDAVSTGDSNLVLMGIEPTYPSEKYGYIKPAEDGTYTFTEKPTVDKAREYIASGAFWNGGVFAYKLSYVLNKSIEMLGTGSYRELYDNYGKLKKISFDYAVVEQETSIEVIKYSGEWADLGTWNTLTDAMKERIIGDGRLDDSCDNVHIINELDVPILGMGLKNVVISASPQGILVSDKVKSSYIKPFVEDIDQEVMFADKSWGEYRVLDVSDGSLTIKVILNAGNGMSYHMHEYRDEVWTVTYGTGYVVIDGERREIDVGDVIDIPRGVKHIVVAGDKGLQLTEVQIGEDIRLEDKIKCEL